MTEENQLLDFDASAQACVQRAEALMAKGDVSSDIYAALEIRWGVEARLKRYVAVTESIPQSQRKNWEVAKLGGSLEAAYRTGDKLMIFTFKAPGHDGASLLFTPVTKRLRDLVMRLGPFLHAPGIDVDVGQAWHRTLREMLDEAVPLLKMACAGELIGMPLIHRQTRKLEVRVELPADDPRMVALQSQLGGNVEIEIAYIDPVPGSFKYHPARA